MKGAGSTGRRALLAVIVGALSAAIWATPGYAHNSFTGSDPQNGARVAKAPDIVVLTFLAKVDPSATATIAGPDGQTAADPPRVKGNKLTLRLRPTSAGTYTVSYRVPSGDGHPVTGRIRFTLLTGAAPGAPSGPASAGVSPTPSALLREHASPGPIRVVTGRHVRQDPASAWWPWALAAAVALLVVVLLLGRRAGRNRQS